MGPQLLLDKSTLQSMSHEESIRLQWHYLVVYAPILFIEILGDIKKVPKGTEKALDLVRHTAKKIHGGDSHFTANYRALLTANLLGHEVLMDCRPVLLGGKTVVDETGRKGTFLKEEPEREALRRWTRGEFTEAEQALSQQWRLSTRAINLRAFQNHAGVFPKLDSLKDVVAMADEFCDDPAHQLENLKFLLSETGTDPVLETEIFNRWMNQGMPRLRSFAPYGHFCLRVLVSFYAAIASEVIGTKATNRIDLEYLMYLPFCRIFSSSDNFHKRFAPLFLTQEQIFLDGHELKRDIAAICAWWNSLSEEKRTSYRRTSGDYPPDIKGSVTLEAWKRFARPREECGHPELTPELQKSLMEHIRPMMDAIKQARRQE